MFVAAFKHAILKGAVCREGTFKGAALKTQVVSHLGMGISSGRRSDFQVEPNMQNERAVVFVTVAISQYITCTQSR